LWKGCLILGYEEKRKFQFCACGLANGGPLGGFFCPHPRWRCVKSLPANSLHDMTRQTMLNWLVRSIWRIACFRRTVNPFWLRSINNTSCSPSPLFFRQISSSTALQQLPSQLLTI
jgi:hypothetical protein